jgi:hypothetical protein
MSIRRLGPKPSTAADSAEDEALLAELRAELDEGAADVAAGRVVSAERHEEDMRRFTAELRREGEHGAKEPRRS